MTLPQPNHYNRKMTNYDIHEFFSPVLKSPGVFFINYKKFIIMGMFDTVKLKMKCPHCGIVSEMEAQTKELECDLNVWEKGDFVTKKLKYLTCIADCVQPKCKEYITKKYGYWGGFGRMFDVKIILKEGKVSGEYEIFNIT